MGIRSLSALVAATMVAMGALPASAATEDAPIAFDDTEAIEVRTAGAADEDFAPGTEYWEIALVAQDGDTGYIASWERGEGTWESWDEARDWAQGVGLLDALGAVRECEADEIATIFEDLTFAEFSDRYLTDETSWNVPPEEWDRIGQRCRLDDESTGLGPWDWSRTPSATETTARGQEITVRIPLDVIGPGQHELFVAPYRADRDCAVHTWTEDVVWEGEELEQWTANYSCGYAWQEPATTTVTVPDPGEAAPAPAEDAEESAAPDAADDADPAGLGPIAVLLLIGGVAVLLLAALSVVAYLVLRAPRRG